VPSTLIEADQITRSGVLTPISVNRTERHDCALLRQPRGRAAPVTPDESWKRRVGQVTGLPFAFELAVA
jgi:hypothetical protein